MKIGTIRGRLLTSTMMGGIAVVAAGALPVAAITLVPSVASAQDYTTGGLAGTVADQSGRPVSGATVTIRSTEQGFSRTTTTGANGVFRASLIPIGNYEVTIAAPGYETSVDPRVTVSQGAEANFLFTVGSNDGATNVDEIVVVGTRPALDFAQNTTGLTVDVAELVKRVPLGRSVTSVALLAPRVISGDSNIPGAASSPSLGGSSVAENAFYVNGLNITNFNTYVGGAEVPFDFYRSIDIKTGGYPAEFGRATGGIVNAVTKSGTNEFMFALHGNYAPNSLRENSPNIRNLGAGPEFSVRNEDTKSESWSMVAEIGGPIWRDHLYAYGLYQWQESEVSTVNNSNVTRTTTTNDIPFWGGKIDAYITDSQRLEFTYFNTEGDYSPVFTSVETGAVTGGQTVNVGGENYVARYTGNFTDWLTLSAAYGRNQDQNFTTPLDNETPYAVDVRTGSGVRVPGSNVSTGTSLLTTEREFYRFDADLTFSWLGDHHVRLGMDNEDTTLIHSTERTGGGSYFYYAGDDVYSPAGTDTLDYYIATLGGGGAPVEGVNRAFYIQDSWDITEDLNLQLGLRHDQFTLFNLNGDEVIDLKDNWGPRLAFSLDVFGNGQDKFYGSAGRYFIPVASNLSFRGADRFVDVYFAPTAGGAYVLNADGTPVGGFGTPVGNGIATPGAGLDICPDFVPGGAAGTRSCSVAGNGSQEPPESKYAEGTKATSEDEFILGYERQLNSLWSVGAAVTYRTLNNVSEDIAVDYLVLRYCEEQGLACEQYNGDYDYIIANPGSDLTFLVREALDDGSRPTLTFSAAEVGLPKARREYYGLETTFSRAFDGVWSLEGSYVLSKSEGNYEGTVLSDNGQADAGSTILYDHPGLTDGTYGLLPNHRAHQFKLFGSYQVLDGLVLGANASVISPRHFGCLGTVPNERDPLASGYGASGRYCPTDSGETELVPRGSRFTSDWTTTLDLSVRYTLPTYGFMPAGVTLRADVFNVFNADAVTDRIEAGTLSNYAPNPNYRNASSFQSPRYVRLGFDLTF